MEVLSQDTSTPGPASPDYGRRNSSQGMLALNVDSSADVDPALEDAIAVVAEAAAHHGVGVLVTRIGAGSYIVRAHPAVPIGLIRQQNE